MTALIRQLRCLAVALLTGLACAACGPSITITSTRSPYKIHSVEPVTFLVFEGSTSSEFTEPLKKHLNAELRRTKTQGVAWIISGADYNEEAILEEAASKSNCVVLIMPAGGTKTYGQITQLLYDVRAFEIIGPKKSKSIWRARVDTERGTIDQRSEKFATDLIERLMNDNVLTRRVASSE